MRRSIRFRSENAWVVATTLVCTIAAIGLATAIMLATRNSQGLRLSGGVLATGFAVGVVVLLVGRRLSTSSEHSVWSFLHKSDVSDSVEYIPKIRKSRHSHQEHQAPPTAEQLHELKENVNTWVPSGKYPKRK